MPHSLRVTQRRQSNTHVIASSQPRRKSSKKPRFLMPSVAKPAQMTKPCQVSQMHVITTSCKRQISGHAHVHGRTAMQ